MKKKQIEKIPYLTLPKTSRKKDAKYIGVTALKNVANERHLFLEVYRNGEDTMDVPLVRIVLTKKDFGNYFPKTAEWTRQKIMVGSYNKRLLWSERGEGVTSWELATKRTILMSENDLNRIKKVCTLKIQGEWWEFIYWHEDDIMCKARIDTANRKYQRKKQALKDRIEHTPELPEQEILTWAGKNLFKEKHFLYYKKRGRRATICCSDCGGVSEGSWKDGYTYESTFERHIQEPRDKQFGICPMCGVTGIYKPQGMVKNAYRDIGHVFLADRYKDTGAVIRYVQIEKVWNLKESVNDKGSLDMIGAYESLEGVEIARTYIYEGKVQTDYHKHDLWRREDFWDDCNLYGRNSTEVKSAPLYQGFLTSLQGTVLQYCAIDLYAAEVGKINAKEYMEKYMQMPQIEMLVKQKLYKIVDQLCKGRDSLIRDRTANKMDKFLGIRKEKLKLLIDKQGDIDVLEILQVERDMNQTWTDKQTLDLAEIKPSRNNIELTIRIMTIQKALNQIKKYAGCEYGTGRVIAMDQLQSVSRKYFDYLHMREQLGYDLTNTIYQRPRDLDTAHNKMVLELNKEEMEKKIQTADERYPLIKKAYRKLRKRFLYEDENFIIRPAKSAGEIVQEGRLLHHCVGGDNYLRRHNEQKSIILMLRSKDRQENPYITVELDAETEKIIQWFGAYDNKPDKQNMQKWLNAYETRLKCNRQGVATDVARQQTHAYA